MNRPLNRRRFMKKTACLGAASVFGPVFIHCSRKEAGRSSQGRIRQIAVAHSSDSMDAAFAAVKAIGGMKAFIPKNARVAILANPQRNNPGAFTHPDILKAVMMMAKEAGAGEVNCISQLPEKNWLQTGLSEVLAGVGGRLMITDRKDLSQFKTIPVSRGKALKEAQVLKTLYEHDILIDVPVTKDHAGNKFTGTMKNLMGLNSGPSNRSFHKKEWTTNPEHTAFLDQCIADLNTVITPDLCVVDATELITTNGPFGPGELIKPQLVLAGNDRVALDAYSCSLWGLKPGDIKTITMAHAHGLGEMDLTDMTVTELEV
jgi:uncharacterized protein (DUF362 family)